MATKQEAKQKKQDQTEDKKPNGTQADIDLSQEVNDLIENLSGDLSDIDAESGLNLIDQWIGFLSKAKEPEVKELVKELKELQKMLKTGKASGHEVSEVLIHIGEQTSEFSSNAEKGSKQSVQRLGKELRKAGTSIARAEDQEYHQQLDSLLERAEGEELTSIDADAAVEAIDVWYNLLNKAEGEQFQNLANSLKELKQALKRGNAKPETIAKALTQVGEQVMEVAAETPRGFKGAIQKLGKQLTKAGESLTTEK